MIRSIHKRAWAASAALAVGLTTGLPATAEVTDPTFVPQPAEVMPLAARSQLMDITVVGTNLIAVGNRGHVLISSDKGETWEQQQVPARQMLIAVDFADANNGWAVGHDAIILRTSDGGKSWEIQSFDPETGQPLYDVMAVSATEAWAVGSFGKLKRTTDGGQNWEDVAAGITEPGVHLNAITQLPSGTIVIAGEAGMLAHSADGGETWNLGTSAYAGSYFDVLPMGNNGVIAFGLRGTVRMANDVAALPSMDAWDLDPFSIQSEWSDQELADIGWQNVPTPAAIGIYGGTITYDGNYLLVGQNGSAYLATPGQTQLSAVDTGLNKSLASVVALDDRLVAVGQEGIKVIKLN